MNYYSIQYQYLTEKTNCGVSPMYMNLPCTWMTTNDKEEALKWFDDAVKAACKSWNGNKLVSVEDIELDYRCKIKQAKFICNEPAYLQGEYYIELRCYTHNPLT